MGFWETLGITIIGCSFAASLTLITALWRFQTEKWFTLKTSTYMNILKELHHIRKHNHLLFMDCGIKYFAGAGEDLPEPYEKHRQIQNLPSQKEQRKEIERRQEEAELEIDKIIDIASFIVTKEAMDCLVKIKNSYDPQEHDTYENHIARIEETIDNCYNEIKKIAKEDLEAW